MDDVDLAILRELQEDGRLSLGQLGERVGLTPAPVQRRLRALEREGWITHYVALLDARRVRRTFEVFLEVKLEVESRQALQLFEAGVCELPEVTECHRISGSYHYLVKVVTRDAEAFERFYSERLLPVPGVLRTTRRVSFAKVKDTTALPLPNAIRKL
ncbi:MAG: Lrp/AsnC family transcriptional regulator [Dermatophilaceae bacterium]